MICSDTKTTVHSHEEDGTESIGTDALQRSKIRDKLAHCIHPLDSESHPESLINVVPARIYPAKANVDQSVNLGREIMKIFVEGEPQRFNKPLKQPAELVKEPHEDCKHCSL